jgi:hypothetical protein
MAALLILALLVSGLPAGSLSVPCPQCCDQLRAGPAVPDVPPCCRLSPDTPLLVATPSPAGAAAARPVAAGHSTRAWQTSRLILTPDVMRSLHAPPLILRI